MLARQPDTDRSECTGSRESAICTQDANFGTPQDFIYHVRLPGIDRHSCIMGTICELAGAPGEPTDFPFIGAASMEIRNIAPKDDGVVDVWCAIDCGDDLNFRVNLIRVDD